ncbi:MAG: hypothetical protein ACRD0Z_17785 [Acidimicrobiales bacterium]
MSTVPDAWGIASENQASSVTETASLSGASGQLTSSGKVARRRRSLARLLLPVIAVAGVVVAVDPAGASTNGRQEVVPRAGVAVVSGKSALYSSYDVSSASPAGAIATLMQRGGSGQAYATSAVYFLPAGKTSLETLKPSLLAGDVQLGSGLISGEMIVVGEGAVNGGDAGFWWYDVSTKKSGNVSGPANYYLWDAAPGGAVFADNGSTTSLLYEDALTGKAIKLGSYAGLSNVTSAANGVVITDSGGLEYVSYSPVKATVFSKVPGLCQSTTTDAVGCSVGDDVVRYSLPSGKVVTTTKLKAAPQSVLVTPDATSWISCTPTGCTLARIPAAGGATTTITLPSVYGGSGGVQAISDSYVWGQLGNDSPAVGIFEMSDASKTATHVVGATRSPVAVASLAVTGSTLYYLDNSVPTLAVWSRPLSGTTTVTLGKATEQATDGYVYTDATTYSLSLAASGTEVVHDDYQPQPNTYPLSTYLQNGSKSTEVSARRDYFSYDSVLALSGNFVLFTGISGTELYDLATAKTTALPSEKSYGLGGNELAWVTQTGAVFEEAAGTTASKQVAPALTGGALLTEVLGLAVDGPGDLAWSYVVCPKSTCSTQSVKAAYMDTAVSPGWVAFRHPAAVTASLVISGNEVGWVDAPLNETSGDAYTMDMAASSPSVTLLAKNASDLSISSDYAAWINATSQLAYVAHF